MAGLFLNRSRQVPAEDTPAFAGIAERFRRAGDLDRAITLCRDGLKKFPSLLSARVTLGWALLDKGQYDEARVELEQVLRRAPDNLAAIRGLAELHERAESTPLDAHAAQAAWHQGEEEEEEETIDPSLLLAQSPETVPVVAPPVASAPVAPAPVVAAAAPTAMTTAPPVIEFTNSAGVTMTPSIDMPSVEIPSAAAVTLTSFSVEEPEPVIADVAIAPAAMNVRDDFAIEPPMPVPTVSAAAPVLSQPAALVAADADIDFGSALEDMTGPVMPAAAAASTAPEVDLGLPLELSAEPAAIEEAAPAVLTLPVTSEVNLDDLASAFSEAVPEVDRSSIVFDVAPVVVHTLAPQIVPEPVDEIAVVPADAASAIVSEHVVASLEPAAALATALPAQMEDADPPTIEIMASSFVDVEMGGFELTPAAALPAAAEVGADLASAFPLETMSVPAAFDESSVLDPILAPVAQTAQAPVVFAKRSPVPALEQFLRKVQARRMQLGVGSVA